MKSSRFLWGSIGIIALLSTCLFIAGLIYAINVIIFPKASNVGVPQATAQPVNDPLAEDKIQIVAFGDSLTRGTGDRTGEGYVRKVELLIEQATKKPVFVLGNFAINGYRTDELLHDLETNPTMAEIAAKANIILLTIGGNDLFRLEQDNMSAEVVKAEVLNQRLPEPLARLTRILQKLAEINPQATIIYIGLFNPFWDLAEAKERSLVIQKWNDGAFQTANRYPNMTVVPTFDLFQKNINKYIASDHFHPNELGYQRIAERVLQAIQ